MVAAKGATETQMKPSTPAFDTAIWPDLQVPVVVPLEVPKREVPKREQPTGTDIPLQRSPSAVFAPAKARQHSGKSLRVLPGMPLWSALNREKWVQRRLMMVLVLAVVLAVVTGGLGYALSKKENNSRYSGHTSLAVIHATATLFPTETTLPTATTFPTPTIMGVTGAAPTVTPLSANAASFLALDTTTRGNWQGVYGKQGALVIGDKQNLTSTIVVVAAKQSVYTWLSSTSDVRAPQKISNPADRIAACWYASSSFTIDVTITDGKTYQMALYVLDWDHQNRAETVSVLNPTTGATLATHNVQDFANGQYMLWDVRGHVLLQVTNANSDINAVVSGLYFANA